MTANAPMEVNDHRNASAFIVLLLTGVAVIVLQKSLEIPPWAAWILPTTLVILYIIWTDYTNTEKEGADNAYYLGFLYTLASLSVTLATFDYILLEGSEDIEGRGRFDEEVKNVMTSFGVALATTIAGIAGRLWLRHKDGSRVGIEDMTEKMIEVMHDQVQKFSATTQTMVEQFKDMVAQSQKILERANNDFLAASQAHKELQVAVIDTSQKIRDNAMEMSQGVEHAISQIRDAATAMNGSVEILGIAVGEAKKGIEGIANSMQDAAERVAGTADGIERTVGGITEMTGSIDSFNQALKNLQDTLGNLKGQVENAEQQFAGVGESVGKIERLTTNANAQWTRHNEVIEGAITQVQRFSEAAQEATREFRELRKGIVADESEKPRKIMRVTWNWIKRNW